MYSKKRKFGVYCPTNPEFSKYGIKTPLESDIIYIPLISKGISIISILEELATIPGIIYIEPNFCDKLMYIPNDTFYENDQYDMRLMGMESAWDYQLGSSSVKVAVVLMKGTFVSRPF